LKDFHRAVYNRFRDMDPAHIGDLLRPFLVDGSNLHRSGSNSSPGEESAVLSGMQLQYISTYIDILLRWNARMNLTAIRSEEEIVTRHFGESFFTARRLFSASTHRWTPATDSRVELSVAIRVADLGSGAGFPGLPIKLWAPDIDLTLVESNHKKATFLSEVVRSLALTNVTIQNVRAETMPPSSFDVVTLRAVEGFATALRIAAALLSPGGRLALLVASSQVETAYATLSEVSWSGPIHFPQSKSRILLVGKLIGVPQE
jgi:16S rRNA (guanine527-N7)-methyltransferase